MKNKDVTFIYELYKLCQRSVYDNKIAKIVYNILKKSKRIIAIENYESLFYKSLTINDYEKAEYYMQCMIDYGINENRSIMVRMRTTLALEKC